MTDPTDPARESPRSRLSRLGVVERSVVADFLVAAIESNGFARRADLERVLRIVGERGPTAHGTDDERGR